MQAAMFGGLNLNNNMKQAHKARDQQHAGWQHRKSTNNSTINIVENIKCWI